jgi:hypothetical protein
LPETQFLCEQLCASPFYLNDRTLKVPGSRGGLPRLASEPLRATEPDLLLGAAELVPPETVSHVQGDAIRGVRFGPALSLSCPVAPAACRIQGDLQIVCQPLAARLLVGGHSGLQVLVTANPPVLRLSSRGQVSQQEGPDPRVAVSVVGCDLKMRHGGFEVESGNAECGQRDFDRAHAAAEKRRARSPGIDMPQRPGEGIACREEVGWCAVIPEPGEVRVPERGQADCQVG